MKKQSSVRGCSATKRHPQRSLCTPQGCAGVPRMVVRFCYWHGLASIMNLLFMPVQLEPEPRHSLQTGKHLLSNAARYHAHACCPDAQQHLTSGRLPMVDWSLRVQQSLVDIFISSAQDQGPRTVQSSHRHFQLCLHHLLQKRLKACRAGSCRVCRDNNSTSDPFTTADSLTTAPQAPASLDSKTDKIAQSAPCASSFTLIGGPQAPRYQAKRSSCSRDLSRHRAITDRITESSSDALEGTRQML